MKKIKIIISISFSIAVIAFTILFVLLQRQTYVTSDLPKIDYTVMENIPLKAYHTEYAELVNAVLSHQSSVLLSDMTASAELMHYFKSFHPLSALVDTFSSSDSGICITYRYSKNKQLSIISHFEDNIKEALYEASSKPTDFMKTLSVYSYFSRNFQWKENASGFTFDHLINNVGNASSISGNSVFTLLQLPIEARLVRYQDHIFYMAYMNNNWYYFDSAKESLEDEGNGLYYFAMHDSRLSMIYDTVTLHINYVNTNDIPPFCRIIKNYCFYKTKSYTILEGNILQLYLNDDSVIQYNTETLKSSILYDKGFKNCTTWDGYHYYLYTPDEVDSQTNGNQKHPLFVVLHGAFGSSNALNTLGVPLKEDAVQNAMKGAYVLVLLSKGDYYTDANRYAAIIQNVISSDKHIDSDNVILYGFSNGAKFSCELMETDNYLFSYALLGGLLYDFKDPSVVKDIPIWLICGAKDSEPVVESSDAMYLALKKVGCHIMYCKYEDRGHNAVNITEYDSTKKESALDWLIRQIQK